MEKVWDRAQFLSQSQVTWCFLIIPAQVDEYLSKTCSLPHGEDEGTERKRCKDRSANGIMPV